MLVIIGIITSVYMTLFFYHLLDKKDIVWKKEAYKWIVFVIVTLFIFPIAVSFINSAYGIFGNYEEKLSIQILLLSFILSGLLNYRLFKKKLRGVKGWRGWNSAIPFWFLTSLSIYMFLYFMLQI